MPLIVAMNRSTRTTTLNTAERNVAWWSLAAVPTVAVLVAMILPMAPARILWAQPEMTAAEDGSGNPAAVDQAAARAEITVRPATISNALLADAPDLSHVVGSAATVAVIRIEGMIYGFTLESLQRRVRRARELGADVIVLDMDTPGGTVDSALKISRFVKSMPETTVAWVNPTAYSAGILIASSCDMLLMSTHAATGDCAPIVPGQNLEPTERAKALSPLLAEFRDNAKSNDYPYVLFHAMCVLGVKIYRIRHDQTGEVCYVNEADYRFMVGGKSDLDASPAEAGGATTRPGSLTGVGAVSQTVTNPSDRRAWVLDDGEGKLSPISHDGQTLLTVTQDDALALGLAEAIVDSESELKTYLEAGKVVRIAPTWSELLAGVLTHPIVRGALMLALVMGAYMEFQSPGLGAPGLVAVLALITLIGAPFLIGLSEVVWVLLFFFGVAMVVVELLLIPGFGLIGFGGLICITASLIMQIVPMDAEPSRIIPSPSPGTGDVMVKSAAWMLSGLIGGVVGVYYLAKHFGSIPMLNRLVLNNDAALVAVDGIDATLSGAEVLGAGEVQVGQCGRVVTQLRPSGTVEINGRLVDVSSRGDWIESGRVVKVVDIQGNRIAVELQV